MLESILRTLEAGREIEDRFGRTIALLAGDHSAIGEAATGEVGGNIVAKRTAFDPASQKIGMQRMRFEPVRRTRLRGL